MLNYWKVGLKTGLTAFVIFLAALFVYGLFNDFIFWHAFAHAGTQSGIAYMIYYGVFAGPIIILLVAFTTMTVKNLKNQ
ncbi:MULTISPECIES: hypothetical protein [Methylotenera]|uniref:hypothetical protein n=1 Tax=Methylotenera TaxID=359407 RepID=UPI000370B8FB|nr:MULTISPECIES: hypothetical protein [Methylotenera]